jgi:hypothetical protein
MTLTMKNIRTALIVAGAGGAAVLYLMGACLSTLGLI